VPPAVTASDLEAAGIPADAARGIADRVTAALRGRNGEEGDPQVRLWREFQAVLKDPAWRWDFPLHWRLYGTAYKGRRPEDGPGPAWVPSAEEAWPSNLGSLMAELGLRTYADLHRWSVEHREEYWSRMIRRLGIVFQREPERVLDPNSSVTDPRWLPGAELNIAESCFRADRSKTAIVYASELAPELRRVTYEELWRLSARVANGLAGLGVGPRERVAMYLPMSPEAVAIYLGVILAGRCVVGIADAAAPPELEKRIRIGDAKAVFTIEAYRRGGKDLGIYEKVVAANGPRAVVLPSEREPSIWLERREDVSWEDFLGEREPLEVAARTAEDATNVLFSSGTTKDPKAIPWTHATPIKSAADAYLHMDTQPTDVLAWPTSFGWMMGPWLTYASLVNRATMALYVGDAQERAFGEFVSRAGVTFLGVVPKLVRAWKARRTMEGLDWSHVRLFASTAEPSTPDEMFYLMWLAGYKPVVEYCGGTEIGGGYITGTPVQPCAPGTFTTPALGLDLVILDEGRPADRGEVFLVPPSIGLSNELLNYDHDAEYFAGIPRGAGGEVLRRHGDAIERLGGGFYRHHGRIDDTINVGGVKTSSEELRAAIWHEDVYDAKPVAVDVDGSGQHALVVYAVPRNPGDLESGELRDRLRQDFERAIKARLNPLLAHVHDVVLVSELPQAGPGKTRTMAELRHDYLARSRRRP